MNLTTSVPSLSGDVFGTLINLSGRRRFTSQRLVLFAVLASRADPDALAAAHDALRAFTDAHHALVKGKGAVPGIFCAELEQVYHGQEQGHARIAAFIDHAERTLLAVERRFRSMPSMIGELVQASSALLPLLNRITQVYEELARRHAQQMRRHLNSVMGDITAIARQARMVAFNAQVIAARAGQAGGEFAVVAGLLSQITGEIDNLVGQAVVENRPM